MTKGWHMCFFCNLWNGWGEVETKKGCTFWVQPFFLRFCLKLLDLCEVLDCTYHLRSV